MFFSDRYDEHGQARLRYGLARGRRHLGLDNG
jgi:hypothetical protein